MKVLNSFPDRSKVAIFIDKCVFIRECSKDSVSFTRIQMDTGTLIDVKESIEEILKKEES